MFINHFILTNGYYSFYMIIEDSFYLFAKSNLLNIRGSFDIGKGIKEKYAIINTTIRGTNNRNFATDHNLLLQAILWLLMYS